MVQPPYLSLVEPWQIDEPRLLHETRIFSLREHQGHSQTHPAKRGAFVTLAAGDWVNVVALTDDEQVVMVEQYRHGFGGVTLEIPGGMVDGDEGPLAAGLRELAEETGYAGDGARIIGRVSPNPAIQTNWCHTVLVPAVALVGAPQPEGTEELGVRLVPRQQISDLIRRGVIHHALVVAAFHHLTLLA